MGMRRMGQYWEIGETKRVGHERVGREEKMGRRWEEVKGRWVGKGDWWEWMVGGISQRGGGEEARKGIFLCVWNIPLIKVFRH
jgi:hypothetical protein